MALAVCISLFRTVGKTKSNRLTTLKRLCRIQVTCVSPPVVIYLLQPTSAWSVWVQITPLLTPTNACALEGSADPATMFDAQA